MKDVLARLDRRKWKCLPYRRWVPFYFGGFVTTSIIDRVASQHPGVSVAMIVITSLGLIPALLLWLTAEKPESEE